MTIIDAAVMRGSLNFKFVTIVNILITDSSRVWSRISHFSLLPNLPPKKSRSQHHGMRSPLITS